MKIRIIWLNVLLVLGVVTISAQVFGDRSRTGGTGGSNTILGRILFPSGRPVKVLRIRLESTNSTTLSTYSNLEGVFTFNSLEPGNYTIVVEPDENFESATETLTIEREQSKTARTFNLIIYLHSKGSQETKPAVINAKLATVPKEALENYQKALQAASENDHKKAIEYLKKAVEIYPQFDEAFNELAGEYLKIGDLDKSLESVKKALKIDENNLNARLNYGIVLLNKKQMNDAEKELRKVITAKDDLPIPHMYLGIALIGLKQIDAAEAEFKRAISLRKNENLSQAHKYLGGIYWQKNDFKNAVENLEKYLEFNPKAPDAERIRATINELKTKF